MFGSVLISSGGAKVYWSVSQECDQSKNYIMLFNGVDNDKKSPQPTWTSLDLLGNRGKRNLRGSDSSPKLTQENSQASEEDQTRL